MKKLIILIGLGGWLLMLFLMTNGYAQTVIHQTIPGTTIRDYDAPSLVIQPDGTGYQTIPGTTIRNYDAPGIIIQGGNNARIIGNQYRIDQPLQQAVPYLWPAQD